MGLGKGCTHLLFWNINRTNRNLLRILLSKSSQFQIAKCKKNCKGFPLCMGSDMGISLGYRAWAGLITQTDASCHRNLLPVPTWKLQNKNLQGILPQKRSHMGIISLWGQGFFAEHQPDQSTTSRSEILLSKFPQFKIVKLKK